MTLHTSYPNHLSFSTSLLDLILLNAAFFAGKWCPELRRNQSRDLLRLLLYKLYAPPGGSLFHRHARSSHAALADKLDLSREWTCKLIGRLCAAGWITTEARRLPNGQQEITIFRVGPMLKRLLVMLLRSKQRFAKNRVNTSSQKVPTKEQIEKNKTFLAELRQSLLDKMSFSGQGGTKRW